ncbi:YlbF family regulator, partial [Lactobacillus jensenii]
HVKQVIMAEQGIYMLLDDIQKTIAKPITDLYEDISIHSGK